MPANLPDFNVPARPIESPLLAALNNWFSPSFHGLEHLHPERGSLFVGNHCLYGLLDAPLLQTGIYNHSGIWLRGVADHLHFKLPSWAQRIEALGAFRGTRENCALAMARDDNILIFPGGGREVMKRRGENYQLIWKQRLGFVALAVTYGYPIQPFASVGADDAYSIVCDASLVDNPLSTQLIRRLGRRLPKPLEQMPPVVRGVGPSLIPRPEPFYFMIGPAIETTPYQGLENDRDALITLRDQVAEQIRGLLSTGQVLSTAEHKQQPLWRKLLCRC